MEENEKKIDEAWKETVGEEKLAQGEKGKDKMPAADFKLFLSSMGMQAMIALGELENPLTKKKETDLVQAKYLIDTLGMLKEKTVNNLDKQEQDMLEGILYQLRTNYVGKTK